MSLITTATDPSKIMDRKFIASRGMSITDYRLFSKEDSQRAMESYIVDFLATCVVPIAYSFDELPHNTPDVYSLKRKRKSKSIDDGPSGTAKPPTKMSKTSNILQNTMRPKVEAVGSGRAKPTEVSTAQNRPHGNSPLVETFFNSDIIFNTISSTPLQPTPTPSISIPFRTISNPKQKQPIVSETITTYVPKPSENTIPEPPQIPKSILSQIISQSADAPPEHPTIITTEQSSE